MNAFMISNKNNDALVATSNAGNEPCDHTILLLCSRMIQLPLAPQYAGRGIKRAQLQVM